MIVRDLLLLAVVVVTQYPATAQNRLRPIEAPAGQNWSHGASGLSLPATLAQLGRTRIVDTGVAELDVVTTYESADRATQATVFIFRPQLADPAIWFDRALTTMLARRDYALRPGNDALARSFAAEGVGPVGLRAAVLTDGSDFGATGVGVAAIKDWIVKVRLSTKARDLDALHAVFDRLVTDLGLPGTSTGQGLRPIDPCAKPLKFKKAKLLKPDGAQTLLGAVLAMKAAQPATKPQPVTFCRDVASTPLFGIYRANGSDDSYVLALQDAGRIIDVGKTLSISGGTRFGVTYKDLGRSHVFDDFNALPSPEQAMAHVNASAVRSSTEIGSKSIEVDSNSLK